jgi:hypothetical protein
MGALIGSDEPSKDTGKGADAAAEIALPPTLLRRGQDADPFPTAAGDFL